MAEKYVCTKCNKRFVDWGAEKIKAGESCDDCNGEFLELVGFDAAQAAPKKKPALKRKRGAGAKKLAPAAAKKTGKLKPDLAAAQPDDPINDEATLDDGGTDAGGGMALDARESEND